VPLQKPVRGLSQVPKGSRHKQKKKNWDNFLGANLQVCHPKGPFFNLGRPCGNLLRHYVYVYFSQKFQCVIDLEDINDIF
jgi:hypothetical protein